MKFTILTIFPEFFEKALDFSLLKKAREKGNIELEILNLRDWAKPGIHKQVDARPYGGGPGMVMMVEPIYKALNAIKSKSNGQHRIATAIFSPKGKVYNQPFAEHFSTNYDEIVLIIPHYEGFDERVLNWVDFEICIGDYVLTGGEIPALAVIDSVSRLIPGVLGNEESAKSESFSELKSGVRNLEHAQYTRPEIFLDNEGVEHKVPETLLSGNHKEISKWREQNQNS